MTYEDWLRLQGQQPGFGFGTLGGDQTTPSPVPPITEVPAPQNIPQMPGQPIDWKQVAQAKALQMLNTPDKKESPIAPLGMAMMSLGQQMQVPPALRGQNNNLQSMANALMAWQMKQQLAQESNDLKKVGALSTLQKMSEGEKPIVVGNNLVTPQGKLIYQADKFINVPQGTTVLNQQTQQPVYTAPEKPPNLQHVPVVNPQTLLQEYYIFNPQTGQYTPTGIAGAHGTPARFVDPQNPSNFEWVLPGQQPKNPNFVSESVFAQQLKLPEMSPESKKKYAAAYRLYGDTALPKVPGFMGGKLQAEIQDIAMSGQDLSGVDTKDVIDMMANRGDYEGLRNAQKKIETNYAVTRQSMDKAYRHLDEAIAAFNAVGNTGTPLVNDLINKGRRALTDDPRLSRLDTALEVAIPEVTRAVTGLGGVVTDTAREHMYKVAHAAQAPEAFLSSAQTLKKIMEEVDASYKGEIGRLKQGIKGFGSSGQSQNQPQQAPQGARPQGQPAPGESWAPDQSGKWWRVKGGKVIGPVS